MKEKGIISAEEAYNLLTDEDKKKGEDLEIMLTLNKIVQSQER